MTRLIPFITCGVLTLASTSAAAVIVSPAPQTIVAPGQVVTVVVAPSPGETLSRVAFVTSDGVTEAPAGTFQASVKIPIDAVGPEFVLAYVRLADGSVSAPFVELIANPGPLRSLTVSAPGILDRVGQIAAIEVKGHFEDGVTRDLTAPDRGTRYETSHPDRLGVHPTGVMQARGRGLAQVLVTSHGQSRVVSIEIRVPSPPGNTIPVPEAGPDQTALTKRIVDLNGTGSNDADGDGISFHWQQEAGPTVLLRDAETSTPYFIAPRTNVEVVLEFSLVVTDSRGATSFPDTVRVTVRP